jgi:hypothetical protein
MTDEENKTPEESTEPTKDDEEGVQSKTISELDRADQIAERQKRENDRREELLTREEALAARKTVGGITDAGKEEKPKEETAAEYKDRVMSGQL